MAALRDENARLRARALELSERCRRAEAGAAEAEALRRLLDAVPLYASYVGPDLRYRVVNRSYEEWFARPRAAIEGRSVLEVQGEENFSAIRAALERAAAGEEVRYTVRMSDGAGRLTRSFDTRYLPCRAPGGAGEIVDGFFALSQDVTAERQAEEALRLVQFAVDHAAEAMFTIGPDGRFITVNDTACRRLGYSRQELLQLGIWDVDPDRLPAEWPARWANLRRRGQVVVETRHRKKSGELFMVEVSSAFFEFEGQEYCCSFVRDVTERNAAQERLRQSERLAAVGTLAAGLAHEINNPLGLILLQAEEALADLADRAVVEEALTGILDNVRRCASIVKGVLQFARQRTWEKAPLDVNDVLRRAAALTQAQAQGAAVQLVVDTAPGLPLVLGNRTALEQVLVNLLHNAIRESAPGQRVTLESRRVDGSVCLRVRDEGRGMSEDEQRRAFDPFFSTHYARGGTGLGLSIAHGIVEDHRGAIDIQSAPGRGSTLTVRLPVPGEPAEPPPPAPSEGPRH